MLGSFCRPLFSKPLECLQRELEIIKTQAANVEDKMDREGHLKAEHGTAKDSCSGSGDGGDGDRSVI